MTGSRLDSPRLVKTTVSASSWIEPGTDRCAAGNVKTGKRKQCAHTTDMTSIRGQVWGAEMQAARIVTIINHHSFIDLFYTHVEEVLSRPSQTSS
jgi:hypothetical protein